MRKFNELFIPETDCNFLDEETSPELQSSCCDQAHCVEDPLDCGDCIFRTCYYNDFFDFIKYIQNGRENKEGN